MDRISEIQAELASIDTTITDTENKKADAQTVSEIARLDSILVSLQARKTTLQLELANLQAASAQVAAIQPEDAGAQVAAIQPAGPVGRPKRKRARH